MLHACGKRLMRVWLNNGFYNYNAESFIHNDDITTVGTLKRQGGLRDICLTFLFIYWR